MGGYGHLIIEAGTHGCYADVSFRNGDLRHYEGHRPLHSDYAQEVHQGRPAGSGREGLVGVGGFDGVNEVRFAVSFQDRYS